MLKNFIIGVALGGLLVSGAIAETYDVHMLNKGDAGAMVFDPGFLRVAPGDMIRFLASDKGHNAESVLDMMPEGAEPFKGKINQEIDITLNVPGLYAVKCLPHFAMGMVMTIAVGDVSTVPDGYLEGRLPPKAKERFADQIEGL